MNSLRRKLFFGVFVAASLATSFSFSSYAHAEDTIVTIPGIQSMSYGQADGSAATLITSDNKTIAGTVAYDESGAAFLSFPNAAHPNNPSVARINSDGSFDYLHASAGSNIIKDIDPIKGAEIQTQDAQIVAANNPSGYNLVTTYGARQINADGSLIRGGQIDATTHTNDPGVTKILDNTNASCALSASFSIAECLRQGLGWTGNLVLRIASWVLWVSGVFFNYSLNYTIHLSTIVNSIPAIGLIWKAFRDIVNMAIIFILLYTAIGTILDLKGVDYRSTIINVFMVGVFMNFSFFFTGAIIDVSNILSIGIYNAMTPQSNYLDPQNPITSQINSADQGISNLVMQSLAITTIYKGSGVQGVQDLSAADNKLSPVNIILITVLGSIFILVTAFTFAVAGVLLVIRTVTLIFVLAFSPMMFAAMVIPSKDLRSYANEWWGALINQSFFAPLYLFFLYAALSIITNPQFKSLVYRDSSSFADVMTGGGSMGIIMNFALVITFTLGALMIAHKYSAKGLDFAKLVGGKMTFGLAGAVGRNTAGRFGNYLKDRQWVKSAQDNFPGTLGRVVSAPLEGLSKATFDARNTPGLPLKAYTGEGVKGGYADDLDARKKEVEKEADKRKGDPARLASYLKSQSAYVTGPIANALPKDGVLANFVTGMGFDGQKYAYGKMDPRARIKLHAELKKQDKESLVNQLRGSLKGEDREKTIEAELRSDEYKGKPAKAAEYVLSLKDKKPEVLVSEDQKTAYESLPPRDRATLEAALITANRKDLADGLRNSLTKEEQDKTKKAADDEANKQRKDADLNKIKEPANFTEQEIKDALKKAQPSDIADLEATQLLNPKVLKGLTPKILTAIGKKDKLTDTEFDAVMTEIESRPAGDPLHGYLNSKQNEYWKRYGSGNAPSQTPPPPQPRQSREQGTPPEAFYG